LIRKAILQDLLSVSPIVTYYNQLITISVGAAMEVLSIIEKVKNDILQIVTQNIITTNNNKRVYESKDVIDFYLEQSDLQKPEVTILNELRNELPKMSMLDIGVGAGRTVSHFAVLAKEYLGIDYSHKMILACLQKFRNYPAKISFRTSDARTMKLFNDNSFDFVLFSFNGVDYMEHEERIKTLREIQRIIKAGGYFCFSSHNLNFLLKKCSIQLSRHPTILASRVFELLQMRLLNKKESWKAIRNSSRNGKHIMFNDGAMEFRLKTYYISPVEQLKQLSELGFSKIRMYSLVNGKEIKNPNEALDHWIYYLSQTT
jgi:ubiquinone/menaquinone biosynthesis C-methylase UbiE